MRDHLLPRRKSIRVRGYDYSQPGAYFVTVCVHERQCLFGEIRSGIMGMNPYGCVAAECWDEIPKHFPNVQLNVMVVTPNHVHGVLFLTDGRSTACRAPTAEKFGGPVPTSLPTVIRSFKSAATKRINEIRGMPGHPVWQRNYFEHVVRDDQSLHRIREYMVTNPQRWDMDNNNLDSQVSDPFDQWLKSFKKRTDIHVSRRTISLAENAGTG